MNCSNGDRIHSEWGCLSDFAGRNLPNCQSKANFFYVKGFKCACQTGEKNADMSNAGMTIPVTMTTTTTTTTITTTAPPHFCIQALKTPKDTGNETLLPEQCKPDELACFFYNCTSGTDPNKRIAEWGCLKDFNHEICNQKLDAFDFKWGNVDNDVCSCYIGPNNEQRVTR